MVVTILSTRQTLIDRQDATCALMFRGERQASNPKRMEKVVRKIPPVCEILSCFQKGMEGIVGKDAAVLPGFWRQSPPSPYHAATLQSSHPGRLTAFNHTPILDFCVNWVKVAIRRP
jgi:hypothetical protein